MLLLMELFWAGLCSDGYAISITSLCKCGSVLLLLLDDFLMLQFRRQGSGKSQYRFYLDYVVHIGERMGFKVQEDVLRIPSNKRVCG